MFLGVQLQCAQCHNHPFTDYKQTEYWGMAAFFMKVKLTSNPPRRPRRDQHRRIRDRRGPQGQEGWPAGIRQDRARQVPPGRRAQDRSEDPARPVLAKWIPPDTNPFFARAMVNRFWYQMFGRGLVNPVDDMHDDNDATHPELLAALTEQFTKNEFDTKYLLRAICNSETYQRTSKPLAAMPNDKEFYSHRLVPRDESGATLRFDHRG